MSVRVDPTQQCHSHHLNKFPTGLRRRRDECLLTMMLCFVHDWIAIVLFIFVFFDFHKYRRQQHQRDISSAQHNEAFLHQQEHERRRNANLPIYARSRSIHHSSFRNQLCIYSGMMNCCCPCLMDFHTIIEFVHRWPSSSGAAKPPATRKMYATLICWRTRRRSSRCS